MQSPRCETGTHDQPSAASTGCNFATRRSNIEIVRGATTSSCFRLGIPSGHSSGSHSTARAISVTGATQQQLVVEGAFKQVKRPVRLCGAEQVKYARLQHRLE